MLEFDKKDYRLITGGAMVLYGLRAETGDIDLGCTKEMADALEAGGHTAQEVQAAADWIDAELRRSG